VSWLMESMKRAITLAFFLIVLLTVTQAAKRKNKRIKQQSKPYQTDDNAQHIKDSKKL